VKGLGAWYRTKPGSLSLQHPVIRQSPTPHCSGSLDADIMVPSSPPPLPFVVVLLQSNGTIYIHKFPVPTTTTGTMQWTKLIWQLSVGEKWFDYTHQVGLEFLSLDAATDTAVVRLLTNFPLLAPVIYEPTYFSEYYSTPDTPTFLNVVPYGHTYPVTYQWQLNGVDVPGATTRYWFYPTAVRGRCGSCHVQLLLCRDADHMMGCTTTIGRIRRTAMTMGIWHCWRPRHARVSPLCVCDAMSTTFSLLPFPPPRSSTHCNLQHADIGAIRQFHCIVSNAAGSAISGIANLTVLENVAIVQQPQSKVVPTGSYVEFTIGLSGTPPFFYSWTKNGVQDFNAWGNVFGFYTTPSGA
jgi:hypothetical protein